MDEPDCIHEPTKKCEVCGNNMGKDEVVKCAECGQTVCMPDTYPAGKNCSLTTKSGKVLCADCATCCYYHPKLRGDFCMAPSSQGECSCDGAALHCPCGDAEVD